jgi:hypothetical protein
MLNTVSTSAISLRLRRWQRTLDEAPLSKLRGLSAIAPKLASLFYRAEAVGEVRLSLQQVPGYPGEGE